MGREREVKVVILGEDRGGGKALKNLAGDASKVEPGVAKVQDALAKLVEVLTGQLPVGGEQAREALGGVATSMAEGVAGAGQLKASLAAGAAVGAAALVAFGADAVKTFVDVAGETRKLRAAMGGTAEDASRLRNTGKALNIDVDTMAAGFVQFSKRLENNRDFLADNGVELARTKTGTIDQYQSLLRLGDAYKGIEDPTKRNVFLTTVFGRAGADLRAVLSGTREEMERFATTGPMLDDAQLKRARDMQVELRLLQQRVDELKVKVAPPAVSFASKLTDDLGLLARAIVNPAQGIPDLTAKLLRGETAAEKAARAAIEHSLAVEEEAEEVAKAKADVEAYTKAQEKLGSTSEKLAKAERAAAEAPAKAARARADAAEDVEDAQRSLADAEEAAADAVVDANRRIEDSARSLGDAHRRELDVQEALAEAREGAAEDLEDLRRAQEANTLAVERAALNVDKASQDIGKSKTLSEEKDARLGLREAELSLSEAQEKRREDAEALNEAEANGVEGSRRVIDAKRGVQDAIRAVGDAERAVTDAMEGAAEAQVNSTRSVEAARRALRDAIQSQADVAISSLDTQLEKEEALRDLTRQRIKDLQELEERTLNLKPSTGLNVSAAAALKSRRIPGRAAGGPVAAGELYEVNEHGTGDNAEYFRPALTGNVIPLRPGGMDQPAATAPATPVTITFNNTFQVTGEMTAFDRWELNKWWDEALARNIENISRAIGASG